MASQNIQEIKMTEERKVLIQEAREVLAQQSQERIELFKIALQQLCEEHRCRLSPRAILSMEEGIRTFNEIILLANGT
jgi:hypothetical protein